ncbi:PrsW family intramembrane metalloprotease [Streptomyces caatingaensis]|uniref:Membrane protein n=1 Tax=Streptomyces caatingaensis TaxID=1678637 RepID=A0A0K9XKW2_9ACTN|nr:PrsW family intramembrane metalloprotease [Streptomyces caatingaensis]KNB53943.1 membrane protein [Streptomyces caatingaensis]
MSSPHPPQPPHWPPRTEPPAPSRLWLRCLLGGLALWVLAVIVTFTTQNTNLLPTLILLGSFLTPGCFALWAAERYGQRLGAGLLIGCFVVGGVLGVLGASVLEYYLLHPSVWLFLGVGLIEEAVKGAALVLLVRRRREIHGVRAGLVLGAAVGFGFAAFESSGYAFNALFTVRGTISLRGLVETEILRGLLAPFGHGLWTAILGGALFGCRRGGRFRLTGRVWATYLGVSVLHALWDSVNGIAVWLVYQLTATGYERTLFEYGYLPRPTVEQKHLYTLFSDGGLLIVALLGVGWLLATARAAPAGDPAGGPHRPGP